LLDTPWVRRYIADMGLFVLARSTDTLCWGLFVRLVGVCYAITFVSEAPQMLGLVGSHGILPIAEFIAAGSAELAAPHRFIRLPTLFWLNASDGFIAAVPWLGAAAAVAVISGVFSRACLLLCYALHLSTVIAGGDFFFSPWDFLLLETTLLALFVPGLRRLPSLHAGAPPTRIVAFAIYFLLFRLQFGMGAHKFFDANNAHWRQLTYIYHWLEWQPMPTGAAWYAFHYCPSWMLSCLDVITFVGEVPLPFLLFIPGRARLMAALFIAVMHFGIAVLGNYGTFQLLSLVLCVACISDPQLHAAVSWAHRRFALRPPPATTAPPENMPAGRWMSRVHRVDAVVGAALATTAMSCGVLYTCVMLQPQGTTLLSNTRWLFEPEAEYRVGHLGTRLLRLTAPFFLSYPYGIFRDNPPQPHKLGLLYEGSRDGTHWATYPNKYNPVEPLNQRPQAFAPYQPRLDHLFIYEAGGFHFAYVNGINPYYGALQPLPYITQRLFEHSNAVLSLFAGDPLHGAAPGLLRARTARYRFSSTEERARTGNFWVRDNEAYLGPVDARGTDEMATAGRAFARRALKQAVEVDEHKRPVGPRPVVAYNVNAWMPPWKFWLSTAPGLVMLLYTALRRAVGRRRILSATERA
jgi:hypothetical protein